MAVLLAIANRDPKSPAYRRRIDRADEAVLLQAGTFGQVDRQRSGPDLINGSRGAADTAGDEAQVLCSSDQLDRTKAQPCNLGTWSATKSRNAFRGSRDEAHTVRSDAALLPPLGSRLKGQVLVAP